MARFPYNSYLKDSSGNYRRVLGAVDEMRFLSHPWKEKAVGHDMPDDASTATIIGLEDWGYIEVPAHEALGLPAPVVKPWRPETGEKYWLLYLDGTHEVSWKGSKFDLFDLRLGRVFKTREEAQAAYNEIMGREI